jgi:hypothetical protein
MAESQPNLSAPDGGEQMYWQLSGSFARMQVAVSLERLARL